MTLKEFSRKYNVPYHIVYEASYAVHPISTDRYDREYPEEGIRKEVANRLKASIERHEMMAAKQRDILKNL